MTRLRFVLKDDSIPNKDTVIAVKGVKGIMNQGGQYQVIIGTHVNEVIKDVRKAAGQPAGGADFPPVSSSGIPVWQTPYGAARKGAKSQ